MAPEYSKAASNLSPLVPFYAVDCDADSNKPLCASQVSATFATKTRPMLTSGARIQEIQGFPTVKVFPRGGQLPGQKFESGERTSNNLIKWATRSVPNKIKVMPNEEDIPEWLDRVRRCSSSFTVPFPPTVYCSPLFSTHICWGLTCRDRISTCHASFF